MWHVYAGAAAGELADKRVWLPCTAVWPVVYYRDINGREPVNDAIFRLIPRGQLAVDNDIERLGEFGPTLPYPWSSQVDGELRELRADTGRSHYRILYRRSHNIFVLLHFLDKRVGRLPQADIEVANKRWADYQARMNVPVRRPPRAAGHDAP
jgi:phage-related protein